MPPLSLDDTSGRLPERILAAMEREIREGRWKPGMKLPPQRQMALSLKVSLGAVTAAYAHAEARGLVRGEVGRGTFVRGSADLASPSGPFDLAHNIAPTHIAGPRLSQALLRLARQDTLADCAAYPEPAGAPGQRRAVAAWIARTTLLPDSVQDLAVRLICVNGAQQGCAVALAAILRPGERLIVESPTFTGVRVLAAHMGYPLTGLALDAEGASPDSLEAAASTGARVAYLQPLHNPTGRVMGLARRQALVEVARRRDLYLVEDDLYGAYASELTLPPLAALAPERVFYVGGLSKSLAPGLRFGYCLPPNEDRFRQGVLTALRAIAFGPPGISGRIAQDWLESGTADEILAEHLASFTQRTELALKWLGARVERPRHRAATQVWAPMSQMDAERVAAQAGRLGVMITPPSPSQTGERTSGLRLCLGGAASLSALEEALRRTAAAFAGREIALDAV